MIDRLLMVVASVMVGGLWGELQGIIMIQPYDPMVARDIRNTPTLEIGPRNHQWFGVYHRLGVYCMLVFAELVTLWGMNFPDVVGPELYRYISFSLGCFVLGWLTEELIYKYSRYAEFVHGEEHFNVIDVVSKQLNEKYSMALRYGRLVGGLVLVWLGMV